MNNIEEKLAFLAMCERFSVEKDGEEYRIHLKKEYSIVAVVHNACVKYICDDVMDIIYEEEFDELRTFVKELMN